ncbi:MAG: hypothetical protein UX07_C0016G0012, partial [Parcubacteria group bacterium GW2011_GWA2_45_30]
LTNCSGDYLVKALVRLGGFEIRKGSKHFWKVCHNKTNKCFTLQNRKPLKKGMVWSLVRDFIEPLGYSEKEIFKEIWC